MDLALNVSLLRLQLSQLLAKSNQTVGLVSVRRRGVSALNGTASATITIANVALIISGSAGNGTSAVKTRGAISSANIATIVQISTKRHTKTVNA
jgi:microcompartment protein CcmL/EutN